MTVKGLKYHFSDFNKINELSLIIEAKGSVPLSPLNPVLGHSQFCYGLTACVVSDDVYKLLLS
jgi:hypothetical protein